MFDFTSPAITLGAPWGPLLWSTEQGESAPSLTQPALGEEDEDEDVEEED